jgi:hypothetical protein
MLLAGYNDEWQTEDGMIGGLIVRNTWMDGVYSFNEFGTNPRQRGSVQLSLSLPSRSLSRSFSVLIILSLLCRFSFPHSSHSLPYFLGQISLADERMICPNSPDPRMWYGCGGGGGPDTQALIDDCVGLDVNGVNENDISAKALYQPYHLMCRAK